MQLKTIAGLVLAALVVTGSAAALPGNAPAQADDHASDDAETTNATEPREDNDAANESAGRPDDVPAADDSQRGPPTDMSEQVPAFVSDLHSLINDKLAGDLAGSLGEQISELTPDDGDDEDAEDASTDDDTATDDESSETAADGESTDTETTDDSATDESADSDTDTATDDGDESTDDESTDDDEDTETETEA